MTGHVNPYAPPAAKGELNGDGGYRFGPIFVGAAVAFGLYSFATQCMGAFIMWTLKQRGTPLNQMYKFMYTEPAFLIPLHIIALVTLAAGGYWATRLGREVSLMHAFFAGLVFLLGELVLSLQPYSLPTAPWSEVLSWIIPMPAFLLGGLLARRAL